MLNSFLNAHGWEVAVIFEWPNATKGWTGLYAVLVLHHLFLSFIICSISSPLLLISKHLHRFQYTPNPSLSCISIQCFPQSKKYPSSLPLTLSLHLPICSVIQSWRQSAAEVRDDVLEENAGTTVSQSTTLTLQILSFFIYRASIFLD